MLGGTFGVDGTGVVSGEGQRSSSKRICVCVDQMMLDGVCVRSVGLPGERRDVSG